MVTVKLVVWVDTLLSWDGEMAIISTSSNVTRGSFHSIGHPNWFSRYLSVAQKSGELMHLLRMAELAKQRTLTSPCHH